MATSSAFAGQMIACPNCRGEFVLQVPGVAPQMATAAVGVPADHRLERAAPTPSAAGNFVPFVPPVGGASTTRTAGTGSSMPLPVPLPGAAANPPFAEMPPQPPPNTARLKLPGGAEEVGLPAVDGKLPSLKLAENSSEAAPASGEKGAPLWLALVAVAASTVMSVFLLVGDPSGAPSAAFERETARRDLVQYYGVEGGNLSPYQLILREAQQAHSRGDLAVERQRYRDVLRLLRAEGRGKYEGLTGTPNSDEKLAKLLGTLLAKE
jgi:hypothetical protein